MIALRVASQKLYLLYLTSQDVGITPLGGKEMQGGFPLR